MCTKYSQSKHTNQNYTLAYTKNTDMQYLSILDKTHETVLHCPVNDKCILLAKILVLQLSNMHDISGSFT